MPGSTFGTLFRITTWGESHGKGIGVVIDGCPAGLPLKAQDIQEYLNRRKPGQSRYTTQRSEPDRVEILSGVFEDRTTGTPISLLVYNKDQHSKDYSEIASCYRPGHADYTFDAIWFPGLPGRRTFFRKGNHRTGRRRRCRRKASVGSRYFFLHLHPCHRSGTDPEFFQGGNFQQQAVHA